MIALTTDNLVGIEPVSKIQEECIAMIKSEWFNISYFGPRPWDFAMCMKYVPPKPTDIVLDIGCGESPFIFYIAPRVSKVHGIDNGNFGMYKAWHDTLTEFDDYNSGKIEVKTENAASMPYPDNFFDIIYSFSTFEHFTDEDEMAAVKEVYRALKPNGVFCGTIDFNPVTEFPRKGMKKAFTRTYTYEAFVKRIIKPSGLSLLGEFLKMNPIPESVDYVAREMFFALVKE